MITDLFEQLLSLTMNMIIWMYIIGALISAGVTWAVMPVVKRLALRHQWVDKPSEDRKIHSRPIPYVGGIAIVIGACVGLCYFVGVSVGWPGAIAEQVYLPPLVLVVGALAMAVVGAYDDVNGLDFEYKFIFQIVMVSILIDSGFQIEQLPLPLAGGAVELGWMSVPVTMVWVVGVINAVNLLDGMDGLAAGTSLITFGSLAVTFAVTGLLANLALVLVVAGALVAFLYYNFNPASVFMGDCGSLFIGFVLATYSLTGSAQANSLMAFMLPLLAMGVPVLDTGLSILRRFIEERPLFSPDRDHIHHRLSRRFGLTHRGTVIVIYLINLMFGTIAVALATSSNHGRFFTFMMAAAVIYGLLRVLRYFRLRDLPWLIHQRLNGTEALVQQVKGSRLQARALGPEFSSWPMTGSKVAEHDFPKNGARQEEIEDKVISEQQR